MLKVYVTKIDDYIIENVHKRLINYVSIEKRNIINKSCRMQDAAAHLLGDVIARYGICKYLGLKNKDLCFGMNEFGKPILMMPYQCHFNISHSGEWVVCVLDKEPIGIDVEVIKPINFKIAERFFSKDEYSEFTKQSLDTRLIDFYKLWTLKESFIKADGRGMSIPLNSFTIKYNNNDIIGVMNNTILDYCFYQSFLEEDVICGICSSQHRVIENRYLNSEKIFDKIGSVL